MRATATCVWAVWAMAIFFCNGTGSKPIPVACLSDHWCTWWGSRSWSWPWLFPSELDLHAARYTACRCPELPFTRGRHHGSFSLLLWRICRACPWKHAADGIDGPVVCSGYDSNGPLSFPHRPVKFRWASCTQPMPDKSLHVKCHSQLGNASNSCHTCILHQIFSCTLQMKINASCRCRVVRYLKYDQRERKSVRSISYEHKARGFRLVRALAWSNSPTPSIDILCYWDWFSPLYFRIFWGFSGCASDLFRLILDVDLSSLFIVILNVDLSSLKDRNSWS
jgi:hypothetical protein